MLKEVDKIYSALKQSAKSRGIEFTLNKSDLWQIDIPLTCPILGLTLKHNKGQAGDDSYSFDRIDSSKGYTIDNLIIISHRANMLKSNSTLSEMKALYEFYYSIM
jgi:hypothetical protein